jgi:hypothetical protein
MQLGDLQKWIWLLIWEGQEWSAFDNVYKEGRVMKFKISNFEMSLFLCAQ